MSCAILLQLVSILASWKVNDTRAAFEFIFFDGEEAFDQWSDSDSLYGARHLADLYNRMPCYVSMEISKSIINRNKMPCGGSRIKNIQSMILLDLIGSIGKRYK